MRSLLTIFALLLWSLPTLTSASALKGVRSNNKRLQHNRNLKDMEKKCKKWAEQKAVSAEESEEGPKADKKHTKDKVDKGEAKAAAKDKGDDKAKAAKGAKGENPDDNVRGRFRHRRYLQDDEQDKAPKETKSAKAADKAAAREAECLEWLETVSEPPMGVSGTTSSSKYDVVLDCKAIANDKGPTNTDFVSFNVNIDVLKDADATLSKIYDAMEQELQQKVAPRVAGCSGYSSGRRFLADSSSSSKIVHVDFGEMEFDQQGCDSSLAQEAAKSDGVCMASDVPVDVYFTGDFPENAIKKVEVAIEEHEWNVDGLLDTSEVSIVQTASSMGSKEESASGGMIGGIVAAVAACCCAACGYGYYKRNQDGGVMAKAELETDEESDEDDKKKIAIPEVQARRVG